MIFEKLVVNTFKKMMYTRCDNFGLAYYFSANDFPGLNKTPHKFKSSKGHMLQGYIYNYDNPIENKVVVFDHGFGGGHESYMKEIEKLCHAGFKVFAYDHTGCMESEGETPNGMAQSLCDLNDCIENIKYNLFKDCDIYVMGHSWGGFSTLNISGIHPEIKKVVVMSGFVSVDLIINDFFNGGLKAYRKAIMKLETESNPYFVRFNGVDSLKKSDCDALLIYSNNDTLVKEKTQYQILYNELKDRPNIKLVLLNNKGHNPNYTEDAVKYLNEYTTLKTKLLKKKKLNTPKKRNDFVNSFDWNKMTQQDEEVWNQIIEHLK